MMAQNNLQPVSASLLSCPSRGATQDYLLKGGNSFKQLSQLKRCKSSRKKTHLVIFYSKKLLPQKLENLMPD